jgi:glycine cleavage system pyridoxal-binding protein P
MFFARTLKHPGRIAGMMQERMKTAALFMMLQHPEQEQWISRPHRQRGFHAHGDRMLLQ